MSAADPRHKRGNTIPSIAEIVNVLNEVAIQQWPLFSTCTRKAQELHVQKGAMHL